MRFLKPHSWNTLFVIHVVTAQVPHVHPVRDAKDRRTSIVTGIRTVVQSDGTADLLAADRYASPLPLLLECVLLSHEFLLLRLQTLVRLCFLVELIAFDFVDRQLDFLLDADQSLANGA